MSVQKTKGKATETDKLIGARIAKLRALRGLSQSALGDQLGVSFQQIQKYETGKNRLSAGTLMHACKVLNITPNAFMKELDEEVDDTFDILSDDDISSLVRECQHMDKHKVQAVISFLKSISDTN